MSINLYLREIFAESPVAFGAAFMKIVIVGCGKVGASIANQLNAEDHEISVVDINSRAVARLSENLDVLGIEGNGATYDVLCEAGAQTADLVIAATARDEVNLYTCLMARAAGTSHTIARVRSPEYTDDLYRVKDHLRLSMAINPELTEALEISRLLRLSGALEIDSFSKGMTELIKVQVPEKSPVINKKISQIDNMRGKVRICTVERGNEVYIANGDFVIRAGDKVSVVAKPEIAAKFFKKVNFAIGRSRNVILLGGGKVSYYLAQKLLKAGIDVKIIVDPNVDRNVHEITAKGDFGEFKTTTMNYPCAANPKTSMLAALSAIRLLKSFNETICVGM